tara:strand:- start:10 stop:153 length:144 start_codon:yes stop_codon:yes gene_type:complete
MESCDFCGQGISNGNSEVYKNATNFDLAKIKQFFIHGLSLSFNKFGI